jgi:hypothetical protein
LTNQNAEKSIISFPEPAILGKEREALGRLAPSLSPWVLIGYIQFIMRLDIPYQNPRRETWGKSRLWDNPLPEARNPG